MILHTVRPAPAIIVTTGQATPKWLTTLRIAYRIEVINRTEDTTMIQFTATDPETHSTDLAAEYVAQLKAMFPEAFAEGKIDFDVLREMLGDVVDDGEEKYGLNWHGKRHARRLALAPSNGTLRPYPEESVDWDTTQNLMIEGDNLEVLKLLQKTWVGKVKLIYIDPPYNTGKGPHLQEQLPRGQTRLLYRKQEKPTMKQATFVK